MSNVYILEPPTSGKVLLKTTVGDIDIELWSKEAPKTCRNFVQLCLEGYYDGLTFHRIVKEFIVQGGDPNGDGTGGESIYGEPFKDEFHQRLKFVRRGLVAMANAGKDDNGSQFFFTLSATPELQNKHTIFAKVTGDTLYNMLKLEEGLIIDERPVYPHKITKTEVLNNPFPDIVPRIKEVAKKVEKKKDKRVGVKNFKLLSFGEEAEEDEEETTVVNKKYSGKSKSTHDVLNDPKLSSEVADELKHKEEKDGEEKEEKEGPTTEEQLENIRKKLKGDGKKEKHKEKPATEITFSYMEEENEETRRKRKREEIQNEIRNVKKEYQLNKLKKDTQKTKETEEEKVRSETFKDYDDEFTKYKAIRNTQLKKGAGREEQTLALLAKFKQKLSDAKATLNEDVDEGVSGTQGEVDDDIDGENWLVHQLTFVDETPVLARDANTKDDDWYEVFDPRNPLNKRRRGEDAKGSNKDKR